MNNVLKVVAAGLFITIAVIIYMRPEDSRKNIRNLGPFTSTDQDIDCQIIHEINARNVQIRSFYCTNVQISATNKYVVRLIGTIAYEKTRLFRSTQTSIAGKELDFGSNDNQFWFWSRRLENATLFYADHRDLMKTRLKTPFNPAWVSESLSMDAIDLNGSIIMRSEKFIAVVQVRTSTIGQDVIKITLIDTNTMSIAGHYIMSGDGQPIASTEILEFQKIDGHMVPKKIRFIWHEENNVMVEWTLHNPKINSTINKIMWKMPHYKRSIDMGKD